MGIATSGEMGGTTGDAPGGTLGGEMGSRISCATSDALSGTIGGTIGGETGDAPSGPTSSRTNCIPSTATDSKQAAKAYRRKAAELTTYHPAVVFCYFAVVITFSFVTLHPAIRLTEMLCAAVIACWQQGMRRFFRTCWLYLVVIMAVALFNSLFNPRGLTVVFSFFGNYVTLEALAYGACSGLMLATVLLWFSAYQRLMSQQGFLALFARIAPNLALMLTKIMAFVPNLVAQARCIAAARKALTGQNSQNLAYAIRLSSQLLEWGMESSLITADSMRARGFGSRRRTSYQPMRITHRDASALALLFILTASAAVTTYLVSVNYSFYPYLSEIQVWWWYLPTILLGFFPVLLEGGAFLRWRFLK